MSVHYAGDVGARFVFKATPTGNVDGTDIDSVVVKARLPDGTKDVTWGYTTILEQTEDSITCVVASDGTTNVLSGLYVLRAHFFVGVNEVLSSAEEVALVKPARSGEQPDLPPPWAGIEQRIVMLEDGGGNARPYAPKPTLTGAAVDPADLDLVTATYNMPVTHASVAGITIPGTGRTVTGVASGDTTANPIYQLSGDLNQATDSDAELTIAASNGVRSAFGATAAAGDAPLVFGLNRSARVHLVLSQSNGVAEPHGPQKGNGADRAQLGADIRAVNHLGAIVPAVSGGANVRVNTDGSGTGTGPGLGLKYARFARRLADAIGGNITFCALGRTGQGYDYHRKDSVTLAYLGEVGDNTQHATLNEYLLAQSLLATAGLTPDVIHIEWGEAHGAETKASFKPKRLEYIEDLHADYPLASIIIHTPVAAPVSGATQYDGVREADAELASELAYVYLYDAAPLAVCATADTLSDMRETSADPTGVHLSQDGFVRNGDRAFLWYRDQTIPAHVAYDNPSIGALAYYAEKRSVQGAADHIVWPDHITGLAGRSLVPAGADPATPQHVPFLAALNNRPATLFSATTKSLAVNGLPIVDNDLLTLIVVCYPSDVATANQHVVSAYNSTVSGARVGLQLVNPSGGMMSIHGVGGTDYTFGAGAAPLAVPQVLALQYGADIRLFRAGNGAIGQIGNTLTLAGTGGAQNLGVAIDLTVGATAVDDQSANFRGHIAKVLVFNNADSPIAKMRSLAREHGINVGA